MSIQPTRRSVIRASAWGAPAIVVASAVPAFAASASVLLVGNGATRVAPNRRLTDYQGLYMDSFVVQPNAAIAAGALTLTLSATTSDGEEAFLYIYDQEPNYVYTRISPWVSPSQMGGTDSTVVYNYPTAVSAGSTASATGDAVLVLNSYYDPVRNPIVTVVVSAPGFASVTRRFQGAESISKGNHGTRTSSQHNPLPRS